MLDFYIEFIGSLASFSNYPERQKCSLLLPFRTSSTGKGRHALPYPLLSTWMLQLTPSGSGMLIIGIFALGFLSQPSGFSLIQFEKNQVNQGQGRAALDGLKKMRLSSAWLDTYQQDT